LTWFWKNLPSSHHDLAKVHYNLAMILKNLVKTPPWSCQEPTILTLSKSCQYPIVILPWSCKILPSFPHDRAKILSKSCQDPIIILSWSWKILLRSHHDLAKILPRSCENCIKTLPLSYCNLAIILQDLFEILQDLAKIS
jgi:hypothetical protein